MSLTLNQFEAIYRQHEKSLFNFSLRWLSNPILAEEIMHEAFIRIWNRKEDIELATIKSLLYKTIQNLALNEIRKKKVQQKFRDVLIWLGIENQTSHFNNDEKKIIEQENSNSLEAALNQLPTELKKVILLTTYSDMSYGEVSKILNVAEGTVASRKNRALQLMRTYLENLEEKID